ncbi:MAG TPA: hypothetical protein VGK24_06250 [Candidatus Angelobacter sp.]|jgi:hypothetical protein
MQLLSLRSICTSTLILWSVIFISSISTKAYADVTVSAPANGVAVASSFLLQASAANCQTQPTSSMAYSFDSNADHILNGATSINQTVTTTAGGHILRVKAWGNSGAFCETDLNITVSSQAVVVSAPSNNATVASTFPLQAQASACNGASTSSMAYSFDNLTDHILSGQQSINQSVTAPSNGAHLLRVKAWNVNGGLCETDVSITVSTTGGGGLVPGSTANAYSRIELLNNYTGSYDSCPPGSAGQGVGGATGNSFQLWLTQPDCGTVGNKNGTTSVVSPPATPSSGDTQVRQYTMNYDGSNGAGVRWFIPLSNSSSANDDVYSHFQYDVWVYFNQASINAVYNLEMDLNQTVGNPAQYLYIFATQCNMVAGHWQLGNGWPLTADQTCSRSQFQPGWHHVQIQFHRNPSPTSITFDAEAIDGTVQNFTCNGGACTVNVSSGTSWGANVLGPNFQVDGITGGSSITGYADQFTIYRW